MENVAVITELKSENASLKHENTALRTELAEVNAKLSWLMEQLSSNRRKMFGQSSEKGVYDQVGLFEDEPQIAPMIDHDEQTDEKPAKQRPKKRGELGSRLPDNMPVEIVECVLPEEERVCMEHGEPMRPIGKELVRRELKFTPAKASIVEYWRYAYSCRACEDSSVDSVSIIKAELPPQLIKGSICAPETLAHIAVQKCVMGSPLYRQEAEWKRTGLPITRQTMANWLIRGSEDYLEPIYDRLHQKLCQHRFLHSDSTDFQVLNEPGRSAQSKSQMWVYRTSGDADHPIVLYDYQTDKKQERPKDFLKGFSGYLMTDGFSSYHCLPDEIVVVGCFSHCRRRFTDALKCLKEHEQPGSLALIGKDHCDSLFKLEREVKDKTFEERYAIRNEKARPILDEFLGWLNSVEAYVAPKSKIGKAVNYALNQWKYLERYLLDGRIEISNNRCERSVKPFVINRKNFLFADSVAGARAAAVLHSFTETAKESGLDPFSYLTFIFRSAAGVNLRENEALLEMLLPENAPLECRAAN